MSTPADNLPAETAPMPFVPAVRTRASAAETFYRSLVETIEEFQTSLSPDESAVAIHVTPDGDPLQVHSITFRPPNILTFEGTDSAGQKALAIVHFEGATLTLKAIPKEPEEGEGRRIGFRASFAPRENALRGGAQSVPPPPEA